MKNFVWIILFTSFIHCTSKGQEVIDECTVTKISQRAFKKGKEKSKNAFIDTIQIVEKLNSKLVFPLDNSKSFVIKDSLDDLSSDVVIYKSIGFLPSFYSYLVKVTFLDGEENWLINKSNGEITKLLRYFYVSPIDSVIVTFDLPEDDNFTGIKVLKKCKKGIETLCDIHPKKWYPSDGYWMYRNEFILKVIKMDSATIKNGFYKITINY